MAVAKAGSRQFEMNAESVSMARLENPPTAYFVAENQAITEDTAMNFGKLTMTEKTCGVLVRISEDLLRNGMNAAEVLQNAMSEALAQKLDYMALFGVGAGTEPMGLFNEPTAKGMNETDLGEAVLTGYDNLLTCWGQMMDDNCPDENLSMIMNSRDALTFGKMKTGEGEYISAVQGEPDPIKRMAKFVSNQIPTTLTHGSTTPTSAIFMGQFNQLLIGNRLDAMQVKIGYDDTAFSKRQVLYRLTWVGDFMNTRPSWFSRLVGIV